ncbi:MAG: hypothetical protein WAU78_02485 [Roseiarcus sp.]
MSTFRFRQGEPIGLSVMRFTLTYDGPLSSNGSAGKRSEKKQAIREHIHAQLAELWDSHPSLIGLRRSRYVSAHIAGIPESDSIAADTGGLADDIDLCAPVTKGGVDFLPLVRDRLKLKCSLTISFLRKETPGRVYQGGDLDNRVKMLLDALTVPRHDEQVVPSAIKGVTYCLLEDDGLITGLDVQSRRMLGGNDAAKNDVKLFIDVDVRVSDVGVHNRGFLGD